MTNRITATDDLAARIRAARAISNQSQTELASRIGISRPTLGKWERGESEIPRLVKAGLIQELSAATGLAESFFTEGKETR